MLIWYRMTEEPPNTVMELTATFAACAAVPRTCFRMSAAHHHVRRTTACNGMSSVTTKSVSSNRYTS